MKRGWIDDLGLRARDADSIPTDVVCASFPAVLGASPASGLPDGAPPVGIRGANVDAKYRAVFTNVYGVATTNVATVVLS